MSDLSEILTVFGTFKDYESAKLAIDMRIGKGVHTRKIYSPGLLGFAQYLQGYYLLYVSDAAIVGNIASIYIEEFRS
jgi:hypothetical protein